MLINQFFRFDFYKASNKVTNPISRQSAHKSCSLEQKPQGIKYSGDSHKNDINTTIYYNAELGSHRLGNHQRCGCYPLHPSLFHLLVPSASSLLDTTFSTYSSIHLDLYPSLRILFVTIYILINIV